MEDNLNVIERANIGYLGRIAYAYKDKYHLTATFRRDGASVFGADQKWGNFFRVNIAHQNLLALLQEFKETPPAGAEGQDFGLSPEDWDVTGVLIQYELEEEGGTATLAGSFTGFEAYVSNGPI